MTRLPLRAAGTAAPAGAVLLRALRALGNPECVLRFFGGGSGPAWALIGAALFFGPYLAALSAGPLAAGPGGSAERGQFLRRRLLHV